MKKYFWIIICILIYCLPLCAVVYISEQEKMKYVEDTEFDFEISSYGEVKQIDRTNISEYYVVDALVTSIEEQSLELFPNNEVCVDINEEIEKNQILAMSGEGKIIADFDGIITDIRYDDKIIIKYYDLSKLVLETYLSEEKYDIISSKELQDENGNRIELVKKSKILEDGMFKVILSIPNGLEVMYGKELNDFYLYTGVEYSNVLVVDRDCVYKNNQKYYVRKVDEAGKFISECEVKVGFSDEQYICISGDDINEGDYCDSGYSEMKEDNIEYEDD